MPNHRQHCPNSQQQQPRQPFTHRFYKKCSSCWSLPLLYPATHHSSSQPPPHISTQFQPHNYNQPPSNPSSHYPSHYSTNYPSHHSTHSSIQHLSLQPTSNTASPHFSAHPTLQYAHISLQPPEKTMAENPGSDKGSLRKLTKALARQSFFWWHRNGTNHHQVGRAVLGRPWQDSIHLWCGTYVTLNNEQGWESRSLRVHVYGPSAWKESARIAKPYEMEG